MNTPHSQPPRRSHNDAIDPTLEALLDEALASPAPADDLSDRVFATTQAKLARRRRDGVLARIGLASTWRAAAAVAVVGLLGWFTTAVLTQPEGEQPEEGGQQFVLREEPVVLSEQEERELLAVFAAAEGLDFNGYEGNLRLIAAADAPAGDEWDAERWTAHTHDPVDALLDTLEADWLGADDQHLF